MFAGVCKEWGLDPGLVFDDDFLAWQFRVGLYLRLRSAAEDAKGSERHDRAIDELDREMRWR